MNAHKKSVKGIRCYPVGDSTESGVEKTAAETYQRYDEDGVEAPQRCSWAFPAVSYC